MGYRSTPPFPDFRGADPLDAYFAARTSLAAGAPLRVYAMAGLTFMQLLARNLRAQLAGVTMRPPPRPGAGPEGQLSTLEPPFTVAAINTAGFWDEPIQAALYHLAHLSAEATRVASGARDWMGVSAANARGGFFATAAEWSVLQADYWSQRVSTFSVRLAAWVVAGTVAVPWDSVALGAGAVLPLWGQPPAAPNPPNAVVTIFDPAIGPGGAGTEQGRVLPDARTPRASTTPTADGTPWGWIAAGTLLALGTGAALLSSPSSRRRRSSGLRRA